MLMKASKSGKLGILMAALLAFAVLSVPGAATASDSNGDRIPDRWEKQHRLSLKVDQRLKDQDRDGLRNRGEWLSQTNPRDRDSDDDGISDRREKAGVISAYNAEAQTMTLTLFAGGEISGKFTDHTKVKCKDYPVTEPGAGVSRSERGDTRSNDDNQSGNCSLTDLAEGVQVFKARISLSADGIVFRRIDIDKPAATG